MSFPGKRWKIMSNKSFGWEKFSQSVLRFLPVQFCLYPVLAKIYFLCGSELSLVTPRRSSPLALFTKFSGCEKESCVCNRIKTNPIGLKTVVKKKEKRITFCCYIQYIRKIQVFILWNGMYYKNLSLNKDPWLT